MTAFRKFFSVILALAAVFSLNACGKSPRDIYLLLNILSESFSEEYGPSVLYADTETEGFTAVGGEALGRLYLGRREVPPCHSEIIGYAIRLPLDDSGFEIHIVKCASLSDTEEVCALLQKRIDRLQGAEIKEYAPESYERYFVGAETAVFGDTVFLLATPDNLSVKRLIKRSL